MSSLRIALVHPFSWPEVRRGGERYLDDLVGWLSAAGHRVSVITGTDGSPREAIRDGVVVRRKRHIRSARLERRGLTAVETFGLRAVGPLLVRRYDVVHALTPSGAIAGRLAAQPTLYTVLGYPTPELAAAIPPVQRRLLEQAVRRATAVAALSRAAAEATERTFGRSAEVLSPGIRLGDFPLEAAPRTGPPRILFTSFATNPDKGLETMLSAFAMVLGRMPGARLVLGGPGDHEWAVAGLGADAGRVRDAIDVVGVGSPEDVPRRYREATVTVLPSRYEAFGLVLVESLASGTPVVCAGDDSGASEIASSPQVGLVVPFGDPAALARALEETIALAADPLTPRRCREHSRRWSWDEIGPAHEALYLRVASRTRRHRSIGSGR